MKELNKHIEKALALGDLKYKIIIYLFMKLGYSNKKLQAMEIRNKKYKKIYKKYKKKLDKINYKKEMYSKDGIENVWVCWFQGEKDAPPIVKTCIASIKKYSKNKKLHVIDRNNFMKYVNIPSYIIEKWKKGTITDTHFSDILRLELLIKYGGTWLDATTLLTGEISEFIYERNLFMFTSKNIEDCTITANSWFIFSVKENRILKTARDLLYDYWKRENKLKEYFLLHFFITMAIKKYSTDWEDTFWITDDIAHTVSLNLYKKYNKEEWNEILKLSTIHKLTYKIDKNKDLKNTFYDYIINNGDINE